MARPKLSILHEDEHMLVINKPAGLLSIPDRYDAQKPNARHMLEKKYGKIWVVHRLDKNTSGLVCFALHEAAHKSLSAQFEDRTVEKQYWAIVYGRPPATEGTIEKPIAPHPYIRGKMAINPKGKNATTHYRAIETFGHYALLECQIETGRTHQIRVHLESLGCPIAGDGLYGKSDTLFLSAIKQRGFKLSKGTSERALLNRQALHAIKLKLVHPFDEQAMSFEAPLPKDMSATLNQLRKWNK
jgi:23S rRNA pseudouridine1911/1915/1917 synthase